MSNPLLELPNLPAFNRINAEHIEPAIDTLLAQCRETVERLITENKNYNWANLIEPLTDQDDELNRAWSPVSHLHSVADTDKVREAYNNCLPKLTDYATAMGQHESLYQAYKQIAESDEYANLDQAQQKSIDNALRDFRLSGIALDEVKRERYKEIKQKLSKAQTKFEENLLDATHAWSKHVTDKSLLSGLPESALALAKQQAERDKKDGWIFTLDIPSYLPVMQYAENRQLRQEMYEAYVTRASSAGNASSEWDNSDLMVDILSLRQQLATLLEFDSYADYSLERKMAKAPGEVLEFLNDLAKRSKPVAQTELEELKIFARQSSEISKLEAWDIAFYSEKLREDKFDFSQEELRPYFPVPKVLSGMFAIVNRLYGLNISERTGIETWHPDVRYFEIFDEDKQLSGSFFLDLYARQHKRGGAWMDECVVRKKSSAGLQSPVAYLTCNFTPPIGDDPSLLTHDEVQTLFHEFGHGLHHMLTRVDYPAVSGINGVPWDAVELPSQFMENWCWEREALDLIAEHYQTGDTLPNALFNKMQDAKTFQAGMQMVRQLEFSIFDFRLHSEKRGETAEDIQALLNEVRGLIAVVIPPDYNRFQNSFSHIFAGGYAAGYYSYKWAEVLSADAFSKFEENGIFDKETGKQFLHSILERGGAQDPMELFIEFRGRKPSTEALLRHAGILPESTAA